MPRIDQITLRCRDPQAQQRFYVDVLGMVGRNDGTIGYRDEEAGLVFELAEKPYQPSNQDVYWKIALAVPNIELACDQLHRKGVQVGAARQFQDIGYLAHFQDPEGFTIELIEHWFKGNRPDQQHDTARLGGGATLNLLTLRTHDIAAIHKSCLDWGMTPLSVQHVHGFGFTLYFYAFTDEHRPNPDLTAVENREWLYQRPYTVLEIQEMEEAPQMHPTPDGAAGYAGAKFAGMVRELLPNALQISAKTL
ncbi:VOC family protein [uncultured Roseobacter sp.]|uniref:VOC family protein n=1 Tax=uncultured Roseobacter sp. TaxID=114847 RepID=UPI00260BC995|nr:VOC family protein [uncultured Roseobacter sp.]